MFWLREILQGLVGSVVLGLLKKEARAGEFLVGECKLDVDGLFRRGWREEASQLLLLQLRAQWKAVVVENW